MKRYNAIERLLNEDFYFMENYGTSGISEENYIETLNNFDNLPKVKQKEFLYYTWSLARNSNEMRNFPLEIRMRVFNKILKNSSLLTTDEIIEIFETILTFRPTDFVEIAKYINDKDQDQLIKVLSSPDIFKKYNRTASSFDKFIKLSILGEKISKHIENILIHDIEEIEKPSGQSIITSPSAFRNSYKNALKAVAHKNNALQFVLTSPYADEKRILISLYKIDPEFVKNEFIKRAPSCEKYMVLL